MSWLSQISHDPVKVSLFAGVVALFVGSLGALLAFISSWRQGSAARLSAEASKASAYAAVVTAKAAGDRAIASMRLQWVQDLRKILAEYHSVLVSYKPEDRRRVSDLGTHLDLMLNLDEPDQKALWNVADRLFKTTDLDRRVEMDAELMAAGRRVLKNEWSKIKAELKASEVSDSR